MAYPTSVPAINPARLKLHVAGNPYSWLFAEYEPGQRVTSEMVRFDLDRTDVHVNAHGVVLFYDAFTARRLLGMPH